MKIRTIITAAALTCAGAPALAEGQSTWDGVYDAEQAARGQALYADRCAECHGPEMEGAMNAPSLADIGFLYVWDGQSMAALYELIDTTMPVDAIGSLKPGEIADLMAAILAANAYPAGEGSAALPADPGALDGIVILREP